MLENETGQLNFLSILSKIKTNIVICSIDGLYISFKLEQDFSLVILITEINMDLLQQMVFPFHIAIYYTFSIIDFNFYVGYLAAMID